MAGAARYASAEQGNKPPRRAAEGESSRQKHQKHRRIDGGKGPPVPTPPSRHPGTAASSQQQQQPSTQPSGTASAALPASLRGSGSASVIKRLREGAPAATPVGSEGSRRRKDNGQSRGEEQQMGKRQKGEQRHHQPNNNRPLIGPQPKAAAGRKGACADGVKRRHRAEVLDQTITSAGRLLRWRTSKAVSVNRYGVSHGEACIQPSQRQDASAEDLMSSSKKLQRGGNNDSEDRRQHRRRPHAGASSDGKGCCRGLPIDNDDGVVWRSSSSIDGGAGHQYDDCSGEDNNDLGTNYVADAVVRRRQDRGVNGGGGRRSIDTSSDGVGIDMAPLCRSLSGTSNSLDGCSPVMGDALAMTDAGVITPGAVVVGEGRLHAGRYGDDALIRDDRCCAHSRGHAVSKMQCSPRQGLLATASSMPPAPALVQQPRRRTLPNDDGGAATAAAAAYSSLAPQSLFSAAMADSFSTAERPPMLSQEQTAAPASSRAWGEDHLQHCTGQITGNKDVDDDDLRDAVGFGFPAALSAEAPVPADTFRASRSSSPQIPALSVAPSDEEASHHNGPPSSWSFETRQLRSRGDYCDGSNDALRRITSTSYESLAARPLLTAHESRGPSEQPSATSLLQLAADVNNLQDANGRGHLGSYPSLQQEEPSARYAGAYFPGVVSSSYAWPALPAASCHQGHQDQVSTLLGSHASDGEPAEVLYSPQQFLSIRPHQAANSGADRGAEIMATMTLGNQHFPPPSSNQRRSICGSAGRMYSDGDDGRQDASVTFKNRPGHGYGGDDAMIPNTIGRCMLTADVEKGCDEADDEKGCDEDRSRITSHQKQNQAVASCWYLDHQLDTYGGRGAAGGIMPYDGTEDDSTMMMTALLQVRGISQNHRHHHQVLTQTSSRRPDGDNIARLLKTSPPPQIPETHAHGCSGLATSSGGVHQCSTPTRPAAAGLLPLHLDDGDAEVVVHGLDDRSRLLFGDPPQPQLQFYE